MKNPLSHLDIGEKLGLIEYAKIDASVNLNIESTRQKISSDL